MKKKHFALIALFFIVSGTLVNAQESSLVKKVRSLLDKYEVALSSKSSSNVADCFHNDAFILPEGKHVVKNREGIMDNFKALETIDFVEKFVIEETILAGEFVIIQTKNMGSWKDPQTSQSGNFEVKAQMILKPNQNGELKIYRYIYNSNGGN